MANKIPTIIVGVGGIGSSIVLDVHNQLSEEDKKTIATVCLDTDTAMLEALRRDGIDAVIQTSSDLTVGRYAEQVKQTHPEVSKWMHNNSYINSKGLNEGAGQIRQLSRLAMLASIDDYRFNAIDDAINKINHAGTIFQQSMKVIIVGSIAGGTGAGLMVQLPLYLKERIQSKTQRGSVLVRGIFIGPTITEEKQGNDEDKICATFGNAYACVKEINGLNAFASRNKDDIPITIEYYEPKKGRDNKEINPVPYDFLFLLDKNNYRGGVLGADAVMEDYIKMAANILRAQLTAIGAKVYSSEDNLIRGQIITGGLNRFCGAGAIGMVYPVEQVSEYCALRWATESISSQWRKLDVEYLMEKKRDAQQQSIDPSFVPMKKEEYYTKRFRELSAVDGSDQFFKLLGAELASQGVVDTDTESAYSDPEDQAMMLDDYQTDKIIDLLRSIDQHIETSAVPESLETKRAECEIRNTSIVNASGAYQATVVDDNLKRVKAYGKAVKQNLSHFFTVADNIAPLMDGVADAQYNILTTIKDVHPITARHILFNLKIELGKKLAVAKAEEDSSGEWLDYIGTVDFDDDTEGVQSAGEAYSNLINAGHSRGLLSKIGFRGSKNTPLEEFAAKFSREIGLQVSNWEEYNLAAFKRRVYQELVKRIDVILNVYDVFFDSLPDAIKGLNEQTAVAENKHEIENEVTERFVFARGACKRAAYEMIKEKTAETTIPDAAKRAFSEQLYSLFKTFYLNTQGATESVINSYRADLSQNAKELFQKTIIESMKREVNIIAANELKFDIITALEYELLLETELKKAASEAEAAVIGSAGSNEEIAFDRFRKLIDKGRTSDYHSPDLERRFKDEVMKVTSRSTPYICIDGNPQDEAIYWGVNEELYQNGRKKIEGLLDIDSTITPAFADDDFGKNELLCYRVVYGIRPEQLKNYGESSVARAKYNKLVNGMFREAAAMGGKADEENEISPHIDKRWHYEAYLPELDPEKERGNKFNDFLTLVGLLGLDSDNMIQTDERFGKRRWKYVFANNPFDLYLDDELAPVTYAGLYRSMAFNKIIKNDVIRIINNEIEEDIRNTEDIEKEIQAVINPNPQDPDAADRHAIISALFHVRDILEEGGKEMTALDLLQRLSSSISDQRFKETLRGLQRYVWDYCLRTCVREQDELVYKAIMQKLLEQSKEEVSAKAEFQKLIEIPE